MGATLSAPSEERKFTASRPRCSWTPLGNDRSAPGPASHHTTAAARRNSGVRENPEILGGLKALLHHLDSHAKAMTYSLAQDELLEAAQTVIVENRVATTSLLQRRLKVAYARALMLMEQLQQRGTVTSPNPNGYRIVTRMETSLPRHSETQRSARSLRDLALTFLECREEAFDPHSLVTSLCLDVPALKLTHTAVKTIAKTVLDTPSATPLTDLAVAIGRSTKLGQSDDWPTVEEQLRSACAAIDRPLSPVVSHDDKVRRAYARAFRYLDRRIRDGQEPHSRVWDAFVPMAYVPQGRQRGDVAATHPEHVVPCKSLAMEATRLLRGGLDFEAVQRWIQPYLLVVWIEKGHAYRFDKGGDLKHLKYAMPSDWTYGVGCRFKRLHLAGIAFDAPQDNPCLSECHVG